MEDGLEGKGLRAERLSVLRAGAWVGDGVSQRTKEEPSGEDGPQISSGEASRPRGFTWKCLSCRKRLLQLPDNIRSSHLTRAGMTGGCEVRELR